MTKRIHQGIRLLALVAMLLMMPAARAFAQNVSAIRVEGNQRVETDAIRIHISQQVGTPLQPAAVRNDIHAIYSMGFFSDVTVNQVNDNGQLVLVYHVVERPQVADIKFVGMKEFKPTDDKVTAAVKVHVGAIVDPTLIKESEKALHELYEESGYLDATISDREIPSASNTVVVEFDVNQGPKVKITKIEFTGNQAFSARQLRGEMATRTYLPLVSTFTKWGTLDQRQLQSDVDRLGAFYYDHGFLDVHVSQPEVTRHGNELTLVIHVDEGPKFKVGTVDVGGDLKYPSAELEKLITVKPGQEFRGTALQHDVLTLSDFYSDRGYAFVNVDPKAQVDSVKRTVNVTFEIIPGHEVLINRINVTGNTKTADKVIRREMQVQEQEPYSASAIRESKARLDRLGFFTETRITTSPSPQSDKIDLNVNVAEANTATLQVSGGYDSYQSLFGRFTLANSNLFGGGESAQLSAQIGFLFQNYVASYTEPWFLDIPLSVTLQIFDSRTDLFTFIQSSVGGGVNTYYPLTELGFKKIGPFSMKDVSAGLGYQFQNVGITGLSPYTTFQISKFQGYTKVSEITPSLRRFTVDNPTDPRSGSIESLNLEVGGIGFGKGFIKGIAHARFFYTFLKSATFGQWVFSPGVTYGVGTSLVGGSGGNLPLYERFFPGGVGGQGDVRGYQLYSLGPQVTLFNQAGQPQEIEVIGGSKELLLDGEVTFPILSSLGLRGVIFMDAGNAYTLSQSITPSNLQAAYGFGIRWRSPFGPIAVNIARPINPRPQDLSTVFEIGGGAPL